MRGDDEVNWLLAVVLHMASRFGSNLPRRVKIEPTVAGVGK